MEASKTREGTLACWAPLSHANSIRTSRSAAQSALAKHLTKENTCQVREESFLKKNWSLAGAEPRWNQDIVHPRDSSSMFVHSPTRYEAVVATTQQEETTSINTNDSRHIVSD